MASAECEPVMGACNGAWEQSLQRGPWGRAREAKLKAFQMLEWTSYEAAKFARFGTLECSVHTGLR